MIKNLSLTTKMILVILLSIIFLASVLYTISSNVLTKSYSNIENQAILKDLKRAEDAIKNLSSQLTLKLQDWSAWDETYNFVVNVNEEYINSNLNTLTLLSLKINAVIFADNEGRIIFKKFVNLETEEEVNYTEIVEYIELHRELIIQPNLESSITALIPSENGPFMFTSLPIKTSEGEGPIPGSLTFGMFITEDIINEIAKLTHLTVEIFPYNNPSSPVDVVNAEKFLSAQNNQFITPLSEEVIAAYKVLNDFYGNPILTLRVETPREIYKQGKFTLSFFIVSVSIIFIVFGLILIVLLNRVVVSRFIKLSKTVETIGENNDLTIRVFDDAKDEIGKLAASINNMLEQILVAEKAEKESNDKALAMAVELEDRLADVEKMNKIMIGREIKMVELKKEISKLKGEQ